MRRSDASPLLQRAGDAALVERGTLRWLLLSCPCGCRDEIPVNLDPRAGPAWRVYSRGKHELSMYPSVWRDTDCGSHFIIWRNKILLFGPSDDFMFSGDPEQRIQLAAKIRERVPSSGSVSYLDMADSLDAIPWDVLDACRHLVAAGILREGSGNDRARFSRVPV